MSTDYEKSVKDLKKLVEIKQYSTAVVEAGKVLERLLRDLYAELIQKVAPTRKSEITKVEEDVGKGNAVNSFTLGHLIALFTKSGLIDDLSQILGRKLRFLTPDNLNLVNGLRNKCAHQNYLPKEDEADLIKSLVINIVDECQRTGVVKSGVQTITIRAVLKYGLAAALFGGILIFLVYYVSMEVDPVRLDKAVVTVLLKDEAGTVLATKPGFIVRGNGLILSHSDLIRSDVPKSKAKSIIVKLNNGAFFNVEEIKIDKDLRLVFLSVDGRDLPAIKIGDSDKVKLGDKLFLLGKGDASEREIVQADVSGISLIRETSRKFFQLKAPFFSIGEGAPVLDKKGQAVGLITKIEKEKNSCTVLPSSYFKDIEVLTMAKGSDFYYTQGILARNSRDLDGALKLLRKAVEVNPNNVDAWMEIGGIYFEKRLFDEEINAFQKAVEADPKNYDAHSFLGSAYEDRGSYDRAAEEYKEALKIQPDDVESRQNLILLMIMNKDKPNALKEYEILQNLNPGIAKKVKRLIDMIG